MNRTPLVAIIVGIAVLTAVLDFRISAELAGSVLFTFALVLCITHRSKWLLWVIATIAVLLNVAAGFWPFHRIALRATLGSFGPPRASHRESSCPGDIRPSADS